MIGLGSDKNLFIFCKWKTYYSTWVNIVCVILSCSYCCWNWHWWKQFSYVIGNCIKNMALNKQALREINDLKQPVVARVSRRDSQRGCSWNSQTLLSGEHICRECKNEVNSCLVNLVYSYLATWCIFLACLLDFPLANSLEREWVSSPWLAFSFRNSNQLKL